MNKSDKSAKTIIERFGFKDKDLTTPEHDKIVLWVYNNWSKIILNEGVLMRGDAINSIKRVIEFPIKKNGYNIGFIDLFISLDKIEKYIYENKEYKRILYKAFWFEIKPEIKSIGEILREINFYKSNLDWNDNEDYFILVTKTKGLKELFKEQRIFVYEYEEDKN